MSFGREQPGERHIKHSMSRYTQRSSSLRWRVSAIQASVNKGKDGNWANRSPDLEGKARGTANAYEVSAGCGLSLGHDS